MLCAEVSNSIYLTKTSNEPNCARPFDVNNYLVYQVCYGNPITNTSDPNYFGTVYGVDIIDHLPVEVNFYSASGIWFYDAGTRTVKWTIDNLEPGDSGCFTLTTKVNSYAQPGGEISNFVEMTGDEYYSLATNIVPVCNWDGSIIYVDKDANGFKNGTNWNDACMDLQEALSAARNIGPGITAIWVAAGTYKPVNNVNITNYQQISFELPYNVALIGHFGGIDTYETSPDQRNFNDANNETILEGQIGPDYGQSVNYIVKGQSIDSVLIDGFTIKDAYDSGIYLDDANVSIANCTIKDNSNYGIDSRNDSNPDIHNCVFIDNFRGGSHFINNCRPEISSCIFDGNEQTWYGIYMENLSVVSVSDSSFQRHTDGLYGSTGTLTLTGSTFDSDGSGLYLSDVTTTMTYCSIKNSGGSGICIYGGNFNLTANRCVIEGSGYSGILESGGNLYLQNSIIRNCGNNGLELSDNLAITIKNNWIHNNIAAGLSFTNQLSVPLVRNNTIYDNHTYGIWSTQQGVDPNISNCIIYGNDTNDLYGENGDFNKVNYCLLQNSHSGNGNKMGDPCFKNILLNPDDLHIDINSICKNAGDPNISYDDETDIDGEPRVAYGRADIGGDEYYWSKADYNKDANVNFIDFASLARAWGSQDPNISLNTDSDVDIEDLELFCDDWLWKPAWMQGQWMLDMVGDGGNDMAMASTNSADMVIAQSQTDDGLMLPDAKTSLAARPARLRARTDKFYDIRPQIIVSELQPAETMILVDQMSTTTIAEEPVTNDETTITEPTTIEELVDWLDAIWQSGELSEDMSEEDYQRFRSDLQESTE
jgi:hypothetical protein